MFYVYLIISKKYKSYKTYVGYTNNLKERLNKHNITNLARQLTPAERREKRANKLKEDTSYYLTDTFSLHFSADLLAYSD